MNEIDCLRMKMVCCRNAWQIALAEYKVGFSWEMCCQKALEELSLSHCEITDEGVLHIGTLSKLKKLAANCQSITHAGISHISTNLVSLEELCLSK